MNDAATFAGVVFFLVLAVIVDLRTDRIPNVLTMAGMTAGLIYQLCSAGSSGMLLAVKDFIASIVILFPLYLIGCLGAGDIKLLSVLSIFLGWKKGLVISIYSLAAGAVLGLVKGGILFAFRRKLSKDQRKRSELRGKEVLVSTEEEMFKMSTNLDRGKEVLSLLEEKTIYLNNPIKRFLTRHMTVHIEQISKKKNLNLKKDQKCVIHYSLAILIAFLIAQMR